MRVDVAAVGAEGDEAVGVLEPQVPGPGGPHRHPAQDDPVAVDGVVAAGGLDRLEDVGLAGPAVAVLDPAQRVQLDVVPVGGVRGGAVPLVEASEEPELAHPHRPAAAVEHDVEPHGPVPVVLRRHDHGVGLDRAVHRRDEAADDLALLPGPGRLAGLEGRDPAPAPFERRSQELQVGRREGRVVSQGPGDALGKHLRIGEAVAPSLRTARPRLRATSSDAPSARAGRARSAAAPPPVGASSSSPPLAAPGPAASEAARAARIATRIR